MDSRRESGGEGYDDGVVDASSSAELRAALGEVLDDGAMVAQAIARYLLPYNARPDESFGFPPFSSRWQRLCGAPAANLPRPGSVPFP